MSVLAAHRACQDSIGYFLHAVTRYLRCQHKIVTGGAVAGTVIKMFPVKKIIILINLKLQIFGFAADSRVKSPIKGIFYFLHSNAFGILMLNFVRTNNCYRPPVWNSNMVVWALKEEACSVSKVKIKGLK